MKYIVLFLVISCNSSNSQKVNRIWRVYTPDNGAIFCANYETDNTLSDCITNGGTIIHRIFNATNYTKVSK